MRLRAVVSCIAIAVLAGACSEKTSNVAGPGATVIPSNVVLDLGKHQQFHALVSDTIFAWSLPGGPLGGYVSRTGMYYAPLRAPASPTITVLATAGPLSAEGTVQLTSRPADPGDCFPVAPSSNPGSVHVEELPEALVKVPPIYPESARVAGVDGLVMVQARVCACGEVDSTFVVASIPLLNAAANTAVRQWIFRPALINGEPTAVWVGIPVKFSLH